MHNNLDVFLVVLGAAAILSVPAYLLSGLFGPRLQDVDATPCEEPTEAEFNTTE
jgi:hypothetical protein